MEFVFEKIEIPQNGRGIISERSKALDHNNGHKRRQWPSWSDQAIKAFDMIDGDGVPDSVEGLGLKIDPRLAR